MNIFFRKLPSDFENFKSIFSMICFINKLNNFGGAIA